MQVIEADTIEAAAERILDVLNESTNSTSREHVIYFDGWDGGLGASAVLRAVAQAAARQQHFDQVIQVDCSKWESRRALQRAIAEQLELPAPVMDVINKQDEDDDFDGVPRGSRAEIPQVVTQVYRSIQNKTFVVIFENGSSEDIDLTKFGFPLYEFSSNKILWTFRGRFRLNPRMEVNKAVKSAGETHDHVFLTAVASSSISSQDQRLVFWSFLVHQEAAEVARKIAGVIHGPAAQQQQVEDCFLYLLKLLSMAGGHHYDLATHSSNYWVCDGIIQQQEEEGAWRAADALQQEIRLEVLEFYHVSRRIQTMPYWTSPTCGLILIPDSSSGGIIALRHFQHYHDDRLCVLKLSLCTFSFSSPPFLGCHNLRFLWLDHCHDQDDQGKVIASGDGAAAEGEEEEEEDNTQLIRCFFERLWVLDVRYTRCRRILSAHMLGLMTQLRELNVVGAQAQDGLDMAQLPPSIRKLRVTESEIRCSSQDGILSLLGINKMELLDLSGNHFITSSGITGRRRLILTNSRNLETDISGGCVGLQEVSLRGCAKLKNLIMGGAFKELRSINISGTTVNTLDLSSISAAKKLDELLLLDCDELRAILWPPEDERKKYNLRKLRMDTTTEQQSGSSGSSQVVLLQGARAPSEFNWYICVKDARLLRSLVPMKQYFDAKYVHMDISSSAGGAAIDVWGSISNSRNGGVSSRLQGTSTGSELLQQHIADDELQTTTTTTIADVEVYADVSIIIKDLLLPLGVGESSNNCPAAPLLNSNNCYMHLQDHRPPQAVMTSKKDKSPTPVEMTAAGANSTTTIPDFICGNAYILHVHDSLSITSISSPMRWSYLNWCRVERCPELEYIFTLPPHQPPSSVLAFCSPKTLWASQLPKARSLWDMRQLPLESVERSSFQGLILLHIDLCPRLRHVLPFSMAMINNAQRLLETLEIMWCGDLKAVFPFDADDDDTQESNQQQITMEFPKLKRIHLQELPRLHSICGSRARMYVPNLESIKVRGCWSLKRLPDVVLNRQVECDCEMEWWDSLQWDGLEVRQEWWGSLEWDRPENRHHHPSLYNPKHSRYYKRPRLLRGSMLR